MSCLNKLLVKPKIKQEYTIKIIQRRYSFLIIEVDYNKIITRDIGLPTTKYEFQNITELYNQVET